MTKAQMLTEDASGKSSIVTKPGNVNLDVGNAAVKINFNNLNQLSYGDSSKVVWGIDARAAINEGTAKLLSGGYVTGGSTISAFIGYQRVFQDVKETKYEADLATLRTATAPDFDKIDKVEKELIEYRKTIHFKKLFIYLAPSLNANTFRRYDSTIQGNFNNRYPKTKFRGGGIDLGINYTFAPRFLFGFSAGFETANTIDSLANRESVVRTTTVSGNQTIIDDKKYTVKDGTYARYNRLNLKADFIYFAKVNEDYRLAWNMIYLRLFSPLNKKNIINDVLNMGTSVNFYKTKGNLAGGIYFQYTDVANRVSNEPDAVNHIDIGFIFSVGFSSIFGGR
ncbi:MAG: hypothetical protein IPP81_16075 [Chitinophagaceae bacterium]|nr:hypothetical protein [Chitinophagaceae bacterium]